MGIVGACSPPDTPCNGGITFTTGARAGLHSPAGRAVSAKEAPYTGAHRIPPCAWMAISGTQECICCRQVIEDFAVFRHLKSEIQFVGIYQQ